MGGKGNMSYSESIIIPLSLFKQCHFEEQLASKNDLNNNRREQLLHNPHISSSEKISLINHDDVLKKRSRLDQPPTFTNATGQSKHVLLSAIQSKYRPQASAVLDFILEHPDEVTWDPNTFEVKIRGIVLDDANIRDILLTLMNAVPITRHIDIPPGTYELYDKLVNGLDMPKSWIPATISSRSSKRIVESKMKLRKRTNSAPTKRYGTDWVVY